MTSEDDVHLVNLSVAVPVVAIPIDVVELVCLLACFSCQCRHSLVASIAGVAAVVASLMAGLDGAIDVECEVELAVGLVVEVVVYRPLMPIHAVAFLVEHVVECVKIVLLRKGIVRETDKQDYAFFFADVRGWFSPDAFANDFLGACFPYGVPLSAPCLPSAGDAVYGFGGKSVVAVGIA